MENEFKELEIVTLIGKNSFTGKYRRDLEKPNWHYYEVDDCTLQHYKKDHMVCVVVSDYFETTENPDYSDMMAIEVISLVGKNNFFGKYRRDMELKEWHCYEAKDGVCLFYRKDHMVCVSDLIPEKR